MREYGQRQSGVRLSRAVEAAKKASLWLGQKSLALAGTMLQRSFPAWVEAAVSCLRRMGMSALLRGDRDHLQSPSPIPGGDPHGHPL
jgi:hypothetical protein